ncbi:MAG TPA: multicopper oxidase family protein, partial [Longimicrobiaceae bacterium]|nr:multicopper oxidase family protein [Longimicrobiaceae bacterium]
MPHPGPLPPALLAAALLLAATASAAAQTTPAGGPCAYREIDPARWGNQPFRNPPEIRSANGALGTTLEVRYTDPDSTSIAGCPVTLRTYNGQLVGPTLRVKPGDVMNLVLDNRLPRETPDEVAAQVAQEAANAFIDTRPHPFNTTNLHTHGLHVSPVGNSDNVLLAIPAQSSLPYEIKLPADHTRGTYWYHAHAHGSTAVQVGSGMAGALIVEDDPATIPAALRAANEREKVFVIGTILYDTAGRVDDITAFFPDDTTAAGRAVCVQGKPGCTWQNSMRRTTVNGQIVPVIRMRPGEVQRWRLIDAAFRETLNLRLDGHELHEIATDGIYTGRIDSWRPDQPLELQPGYRSDVLVKAGMRPGRYELVDDTSTALRSIRQRAEDRNVIAVMVVEGRPMDMKLPTQAEMARLNPFPGVDLAATADGSQFAVFNIRGSPDATDNRAYFQVNWASFNPTRIRYLQLGATDQWTLQTVGSPHVFHIHVNPFQVRRQGPKGDMQTVWKDTQFIPTNGTVNVWSKYTDYIGQFVLHCHILDHEDLGMMEVIEIVGENGPLAAPPAHGGH